jgi:steroid delta-isomerase-like uncharacterized protein
MTSPHDNTALARRYIEEVFNRGNLAAIDQTMAPDVVYHDSLDAAPLTGREGSRAFAGALRASFPDLCLEIEDVIAAGDRVVLRWTARGTHRGRFMGVEPTGTAVAFSGIDIIRISDGLIQEGWAEENILGLLRQLGVTLPEE